MEGREIGIDDEAWSREGSVEKVGRKGINDVAQSTGSSAAIDTK